MSFGWQVGIPLHNFIWSLQYFITGSGWVLTHLFSGVVIRHYHTKGNCLSSLSEFDTFNVVLLSHVLTVLSIPYRSVPFRTRHTSVPETGTFY